MTRKEALQELLVKVMAGLDTARHHAAAFPSESAYGHCTWHDSHKASSGSMGAALFLFEAVLPGYNYDIIKRGKRFTVHVYESTDCVGWTGVSYTPSCALLIAILEALIAHDGDA